MKKKEVGEETVEQGESRLECRMDIGERKVKTKKRKRERGEAVVKRMAPPTSSLPHSSSNHAASNSIPITYAAEHGKGEEDPTHDEFNDVVSSVPSSSSSLFSSKQAVVEDWMIEVIKEAEFCFSNSNLPTEHRFMKFIKKSPEGFVPISVVASCYEIRRLQKNPARVVAALRNSKILVVSEDGLKVRRLHPFPIRDLQKIQSRIVVAENLPDDHSIESMKKLFGTVGNVKTIRVCEPEVPYSVNHYGTKFLKNYMVVSNKLHVFVEYESVKQAERAVSELTDSVTWRNGLLVQLLLKTPLRGKEKSIRTKHQEENSDTIAPLLPSSTLGYMEELKADILRQVEFRFCNRNLPTEHRLMKYIKTNPKGFVPISLLSSFFKRNLQKNPKFVAAALRCSKELVVSNDGQKVRRLYPFPLNDLEEIQSRIVVAENLPNDHSMESMEKLFGSVGNVKMIRICELEEACNVASDCEFLQAHMVISNKLHAFVEYESVAQANRAVSELTDSMDRRNGLLVQLLLKTPMRTEVGTLKDQHLKQESAAVQSSMPVLKERIITRTEVGTLGGEHPTQASMPVLKERIITRTEVGTLGGEHPTQASDVVLSSMPGLVEELKDAIIKQDVESCFAYVSADGRKDMAWERFHRSDADHFIEPLMWELPRGFGSGSGRILGS